MALLAFTYQQGTRIGSLVEAAQYEGTGQCLKWGVGRFMLSITTHAVNNDY